jgi:hypothetical protein
MLEERDPHIGRLRTCRPLESEQERVARLRAPHPTNGTGKHGGRPLPDKRHPRHLRHQRHRGAFRGSSAWIRADPRPIPRHPLVELSYADTAHGQKERRRRRRNEDRTVVQGVLAKWIR